jgi:hypothetical protein
MIALGEKPQQAKKSELGKGWNILEPRELPSPQAAHAPVGPLLLNGVKKKINEEEANWILV